MRRAPILRFARALTPLVGAATATTVLVLAGLGCEAVLDFDDVRYEEGGGTGGPMSCMPASGELSDLFTDEDATFARWRTLDPLDDHEVSVESQGANHLLMKVGVKDGAPHYYWDINHQAPFFYQSICGDFAFIIYFIADDEMSANPVEQVDTGAGIVVRDAQSSREHWLRLTLGYVPMNLGNGYPIVEAVYLERDKIYRDPGGATQTFTGGSMNMALCRINGELFAFIKQSSSIPVEPIVLPGEVELPDQLQVGFTSMRRYQDATRFRIFHALFEAPTNSDDCKNLLETSVNP